MNDDTWSYVQFPMDIVSVHRGMEMGMAFFRQSSNFDVNIDFSQLMCSMTLKFVTNFECRLVQCVIVIELFRIRVLAYSEGMN